MPPTPEGTMTTRSCVQCGHPMPEGVKFCGQCGAVNEPAAPSSTPAGAPARDPGPPPGPPVAVAAPPTIAAASKVPLKTMLGFASPLGAPAASPGGPMDPTPLAPPTSP